MLKHRKVAKSMNNKEAFKRFSEQNNTTLFGSYTWWNKVVKDQWDVLLYKKGDVVLACMPYLLRSKWGQKAIIPPMLTPYQSISYALPPDGKSSKQLSFIRKAQESLIEQLPASALFLRQFDTSESYLLPFHWKDYELKVRYTYLLDTQLSDSELFANLKDSLRREIKKAQSFGVLTTTQKADKLFQLKQLNANVYNEPLNYDLAYLSRIANLQIENKAQIQEISANNRTIASLLVCWDNHQLYYICGALDPEYRNSGALSWLLWEAILLAKSKGLVFNFEGSMIKSIERYFANFGASPTPFYEVKKVNNQFLKPFLRKV